MTEMRNKAMRFVEQMKKTQNRTLTENGAFAYISSGSALLDLFFECGALRMRDPQEIQMMFLRAYAENPELAMKLAFYTRDIRGGLGERDTARLFFRALAQRHTESLVKNIPLFSEYGRWDDLLVLLDTPAESAAAALIEKQLREDVSNQLKGKPISLLAKWLPGINASSKQTREYAKRLCSAMNVSARTYRKVLSQLRSYLNVTEKNMSQSMFECIRYQEVPSYAMLRYKNAFSRHDGERFGKYIDEVNQKKAVIHSGTMFPYDIARRYLDYRSIDEQENAVLTAQWNALPELADSDSPVLVMADVSGSMYGLPLASSVGLAMYFAERCKGPFHNRFLTFSARPSLCEVKGTTLKEKFDSIRDADWNINTNFSAAMELVLRTAIEGNLSQEELPSVIVVITDMEFDAADRRKMSVTDVMKEKFEAVGYRMPLLVYWNVRAAHNTFHARKDDSNVILISGHSSNIFRYVFRCISKTPYAFMEEVLNTPRYMPIQI